MHNLTKNLLNIQGWPSFFKRLEMQTCHLFWFLHEQIILNAMIAHVNVWIMWTQFSLTWREEVLRGPLIYTLILMVSILVYWRTSPIGMTAVALMSGGDGAADLIGRKYGSVKLPWNRQKSWAGSLAMLICKSPDLSVLQSIIMSCSGGSRHFRAFNVQNTLRFINWLCCVLLLYCFLIAS